MYSPLHYGSESKAMPDGDWERKTVSEKHSDVAQRPGKNKLRLVLLTFNGTFMWVKQACQVPPSELCIPNPGSVGKLHSSLAQCGSHEHPDHNQPSRVCPTANCSAFVTASQTHASDQLGLFATTQTIAFLNLKKKEKTPVGAARSRAAAACAPRHALLQ